MKIFNLDCHIGARDFKKIAQDLGHEVYLESLSDHNKFADLNTSIEFLHYKDNWQQYLINDVDRFYDQYKDSFNDIDAFYCFYPSSFSLFYQKFNKPIIIHSAVRFENPFFRNPNQLNDFKNFIKSGVKDGQIILCANNKLDQRHMEKCFDLDVDYIPSLCNYVDYKCTLEDKNVWVDTNRSNLKVTHPKVKQLAHPYTDEDFFKGSGVIMLPYHNSTMAIFERYTANMPLFLPSKKFLMDSFKKDPINTMREISWFKLLNLGSKKEYENSINDYLNSDAMETNFGLCDWTDGEFMKNAIQYDSIDHLEHLLETVDLFEVSSNMAVENNQTKDIIYSKWEKILNQISSGR